MSQQENGQKRHTNDEGRSLVEWITLGISVLILLVVVGLILYQAMLDDQQPAVIEVEPRFQELRQEDDHYYLPVMIANRGNRTAAGVVVELRVEAQGNQSETVSLSVDFLAGGATAEGVALFRHQPSPDNLSYMASYMQP